LEVDSIGLDKSDIRFLKAIIEKHEGGPVGLETLASTLSEDIATLEEIVEPYLMQIGFLKKTSRGRVATKAAYIHLQIPYKEQKKQQKLL
ncbi:MAG: Holliday junction DNA helicase RuvB C-terminal domain-containing protein, partial [Candidatus Levyibacteriota bacterium]